MRGIVKFLLTLVVGIALIWVGFWWYAESRLQTGFTDWAEKLATSGQLVSYGSIHRGRSILNAAITIDNLTVSDPQRQGIPQFSLPSVTLRISAFDPLVLATDLPSSITLQFNNIALVLKTGTIALFENLDPNQLFKRSAYPFRSGDFSATDLDVLASGGSLLVLHIDSVSSHNDVDMDAGAANILVAEKTVVDGLAVSPLLARIASIPFGGKLTHLEISGRLSGPVPPGLQGALNQLKTGPYDLRDQQKLLIPVIHQWATLGGTGNLGVAAILGPSTINAAVSLKFDANLQPAGTADLTADHLDQFTAALINSYPSLQADIAQAEARLSQYLGNTDQGGQTLTLHATYGASGVTINGEKVGDMPPLDWNAAENPEPTVQAPGDGLGAAGPGNGSPSPINP